MAVAVFGLGACGLSLVVDGISPDPVDASIVVPGDDTGTPPPDGDAPVMPDGALDPDTSDANVRETAPPPNRDGGTLLDALPDVTCTTPVLAEAFDTNAGALTLAGAARVQNGRLEVLPEQARLNFQGAAYVNLSTRITHFLAKLTVSTGNLATPYATSDGFAFMALEKAAPVNPPLGGSNDLGMTNAPSGQHGYGVILDIYPPSGARRYVGSNELGPASNNLRDVHEMLPFTFTGSATFALTVLNIGDGKTYYEVRSAFGNAIHGVPYRAGSPLDPSFGSLFLSAAAGAAFSPGFFVDDVQVLGCP